MIRLMYLIFLLALVLLAGCLHKSSSNRPLNVAKHIDLQRYLGLWHEIARYPHRFEDGCRKVTAEYSLNGDGSISVLNQCVKDDGTKSSARGRAKVVDPISNAKLKVSFFWPFYGKYWILKIDPDYQYAIVGEPSRQYLWILNRTTEIDQALLQKLIEEISDMGYDPKKMIFSDEKS